MHSSLWQEIYLKHRISEHLTTVNTPLVDRIHWVVGHSWTGILSVVSISKSWTGINFISIREGHKDDWLIQKDVHEHPRSLANHQSTIHVDCKIQNIQLNHPSSMSLLIHPSVLWRHSFSQTRSAECWLQCIVVDQQRNRRRNLHFLTKTLLHLVRGSY